ncbi:hypothetical protein ACFLTM_03940 [Candidatus Bipolaricaulota bacterium]
MTRLQKAIVVRVLLFAAVLLSGCIAAVRIDLTGTWAGSLLWTSGPSAAFSSPISLDIVHENRNISGTVTLAGPASQTFDLTISAGRTTARSIRLDASGTVDFVSPPIIVAVSLDGDFDESNMSGTGSQTSDGNTYEFTWEVARTSGPPDP